MIMKQVKAFKNSNKWYVKGLTGVLVSGVLCLMFYIVGCQDLSFQSIPGQSCDESLEMVEGLSCGGGGALEGDLQTQAGGDFDKYGNRKYGPKAKGGDANKTKWIWTKKDEEEDRKKNNVVYIRSNPFYLETRMGKISILFVIDTSKSMTEELKSIGTQFDPFLSSLRKMDYRVALTTADSIDGSLLIFSNGQSFLSNPEQKNSKHRENVRLFQEKITSLTTAVAGGEDERGIFALNQVVRRQAGSGFFVPHSIFLAIIVSDEDERTYGGKWPDLAEGCFLSGDNSVLPLEEDDKPSTLFRNIRESLPYVNVMVHSIIAPSGSSCATGPCAKNDVRIAGRIYEQASNPSAETLSLYSHVRPGHVGSICARDYSSQLGPIADLLIKAPSIPLHCEPSRAYLRVGGEKVRFRLDGKKALIEDPVSFNSNVKIKFWCRQ